MTANKLDVPGDDTLVDSRKSVAPGRSGTLSDAMGSAEIIMVAGLALALLVSRLLPQLGEAMRDVSEEERRLRLRYLALLFCLGSLFIVAVLYAFRHAIFRA